MKQHLAESFFISLSILLSFRLRLFFSFFWKKLGDRIPYLYFFMGIRFGLYKGENVFWPGYILAMLIAVFIFRYYSVYGDNKYDENGNVLYDMNNRFYVISVSAGAFIISAILSLLYSLVIRIL